jgi:octaprenyl-diphosphate synthase
MTITDVLETYREDLRLVETQIQSSLDSRAVLIKKVANYLLQGGGKRIRPLLLMVSANLCGNAGPEAVRMAAMVEFIHTASLLHDDVVDGADVRRGRASANSLWGNQATVLVGDYLYSKALYDSVQLENHRVLDSISDATKTMSEGEVLQLLRTGDPDITEEEYLEVIEAKTAALISSACRIGAILGNVTPDKEEALAGYGMDIGYAFQLLDDTLDYTANQDKLGKLLGKDLGEGKLTLPLIHLVKKSGPDESVRVKKIISDQSEKAADLDYILELMGKYRSIEYAVGRATSHVERAKARLAVFPESRHKDALYAVADYVIERDM